MKERSDNPPWLTFPQEPSGSSPSSLPAAPAAVWQSLILLQLYYKLYRVFSVEMQADDKLLRFWLTHSQFGPGCWIRHGRRSRGLVCRDLLCSPSPASPDSTGYCHS
jgi:hypothetical protein